MGKEIDSLPSGVEVHRPEESSAPPPEYTVHQPPTNAKADEETRSIDSSILSEESTTAPTLAATLAEGPDVAHPFAFPEITSPPSYSALDAIEKPLAVPQIFPSPDSGFVLAYPPSLLSYGIPQSTWLSFISTLSSFLDATAGKHAIRHASKIAKSTADIPKNLGKNIYSHTVTGVKQIGSSAKRGNIFGVVGTVIGWPFGVYGNVMHSVFSIPNVIAQKPQTPRQRADVYVETANKRWFHPRRLHAKTMSTVELTQGLGVSVDEFLGSGMSIATTQQKLASLTPWIGEVKVSGGSEEENGEAQLEIKVSQSSGKGKKKAVAPTLQLGAGTLWLVLVQGEIAVEAAQATRKEKKRSAR